MSSTKNGHPSTNQFELSESPDMNINNQIINNGGKQNDEIRYVNLKLSQYHSRLLDEYQKITLNDNATQSLKHALQTAYDIVELLIKENMELYLKRPNSNKYQKVIITGIEKTRI